MSRPTKLEWAMELAQATAKRSTCLRRQVGCVLLDQYGHAIATGYNGVAAGMPHCNEVNPHYNEPAPAGLIRPKHPHACSGATSPSGTNLEGCEAIHAEQNALLQCKDVQSIDTCVVTASPCITCVKLLMNTGCRSIVFAQAYPHPAAGELWQRSRPQRFSWHQLKRGE